MEELILEILDRATESISKDTLPRYIKISYGDYRRLREASGIFEFTPPSNEVYALGFLRGEMIIPDIDIEDGSYELVYEEINERD